MRSLTTFAAFLIVTYFFELYMAPVGLLLIFFISYVRLRLTSHQDSASSDEDKQDTSFDDDDDDKETVSEQRFSC